MYARMNSFERSWRCQQQEKRKRRKKKNDAKCNMGLRKVGRARQYKGSNEMTLRSVFFLTPTTTTTNTNPENVELDLCNARKATASRSFCGQSKNLQLFIHSRRCTHHPDRIGTCRKVMPLPWSILFAHARTLTHSHPHHHSTSSDFHTHAVTRHVRRHLSSQQQISLRLFVVRCWQRASHVNSSASPGGR